MPRASALEIKAALDAEQANLPALRKGADWAHCLTFMQEERPRVLLELIQSGDALGWLDQRAQMLAGAPDKVEALQQILEMPPEDNLPPEMKEVPLSMEEWSALKRGLKILEVAVAKP